MKSVFCQLFLKKFSNHFHQMLKCVQTNFVAGFVKGASVYRVTAMPSVLGSDQFLSMKIWIRWKFGFDENLDSMKMNVNGGNAPTSSVNTICLHCREQKQVLFEVNFIIWKLRGYIQGFGGHCRKQSKFLKVSLGVISRVWS